MNTNAEGGTVSSRPHRRHVRRELVYTTSDGEQHIGWVRVAPDIAPETLEALARMMACAHEQFNGPERSAQ